MSLPITTTVAAVLALLTIVLAFVVVVARATSEHSWGDGGDPILHRKIRAHGNLSEYLPIFLIVFALLELQGAGATLLWALAGGFIGGRVCFALYSFAAQVLALRILGWWGSALPTVIAAVLLLLRG